MSLATGLIKVWKGLMGVYNDPTSPAAPHFDVEAQVKQTLLKQMSFNLDPDTNAAVNTTKRHLAYAFNNITIKAVKYLPDGALAAANTDLATMTLYSGNGAAAAATVVANAATGPDTTATALAAGVLWDLPLQTGQADLDAGETLAADILKSGNGKAVPKGSLIIYYEER